MEPTSTLEAIGLTKCFPGITALDNVSLSLQAGEVHALMGENGAGKSTLMKILGGAYRADRGSVRIGGEAVSIRTPLEAQRLGINLIYQEPNLVPQLSVAENLFMGRERRRGPVVDGRRMNIEAEVLLERLQARFSSNSRVYELSVAEQQMVEIARALLNHGRILLMDEPTAALSSLETAALFEVIAELRAKGIAILYASHRMEEIYALADRVTVLRGGKAVGTLGSDLIQPERIVRMMVGRELPPFVRPPRPFTKAPPLLEAMDLGDGGFLHPTSFTIRAGEILGLAGVMGAGHSELAQLIFGSRRKAQGTLLLDGKPRTFKEPRDAIRAGLGYVPESGQGHGIFHKMSAQDNVGMATLERHTVLGILNYSALVEEFERVTGDLGLRVAHPQARVEELSVGTRQKLLIARWLALRPRLLILNEPTKSLDIATRLEVERIVFQLAESGMAILLISSEPSEVVHLCDRVLVMRQGKLVGELDPRRGESITQEGIIALATGAERQTAMMSHEL